MKKLFFAIALFVCGVNATVLTASINEAENGRLIETRVDVGEASLFCRIYGKGKPLIVIHGGPGLSQDYLLPELANLSENYTVIFYDQRACGKSTGKIDADSITIENYIDDLDAIRKYFGFNKISILGHSWGGFLAMKYAITHPESVEGLILSNSMSASDKELSLFIDEWVRRTAPFQKEIQEIETSKEFLAGNPDVIEKYHKLIYSTYCYDPANVDLLNLRLSSTAAINGSKVCQIFLETVFVQPFDLHKELSNLDIPTLVMHGDFDPVPVCSAENLHRSISGSKYILMEKCGHFPFVENGQTFFRHLNEFLENLEEMECE